MRNNKMQTNTGGNIIDNEYDGPDNEGNRKICIHDVSEQKRYTFTLKNNQLTQDNNYYVLYQDNLRNDTKFETGTPAQRTVLLQLQEETGISKEKMIIRNRKKMD